MTNQEAFNIAVAGLAEAHGSLLPPELNDCD